MGYDAGSIVATAEMDRSPFNEGLRLVRADGKRLASEKFTATVGADTRGAESNVRGLNEQLGQIGRSTTKAKVTADTTDALLKVQPIVDRLVEIRDRVSTARVSADTDKAKIKLDEIDLAARRIGMITARPKISLEGVTRADLQLDALELRMRRVGQISASPGIGGGSGGSSGGGFLNSVSSHAPGFGTLLKLGAVPLAAPVAGLAAGAASSLLTPLLAGGIGGGLFAKTAESTYKTVAAGLKNLTALQGRYNAATSDKTRTAALLAEQKAWASLSPAQQKATTTLHGLDSEWASFQKRLQPQSFKLLATGAGIGTTALKDLLPVTRAAGNEINNLATGAQKALSSPFWHDFFTSFLPGQAHMALKTFGTDLGLGAEGVANLAIQFSPLGGHLEKDMTRWAHMFEAWTEGTGPGKFVQWVERNGPIAAHDIEALASAVGGLAQGLSPIAKIEFEALTPVLDFVAKVGDEHPGVITALGVALLGVATGMKAIAAVQGLKDAAVVLSSLTGIGGLSEAEKLAGGAAASRGSGGGLSNLLSNLLGGGAGGSGGGGGGVVSNAENQAESDAESKAEEKIQEKAENAATTAAAAAAGVAVSRFPFLAKLGIGAKSGAAVAEGGDAAPAVVEGAGSAGLLATLLKGGSLKGLTGVLGLTYAATAGGSVDKSAQGKYIQSVQGQEPGGDPTLIKLITAIQYALASANPNKNLKLAPSGLSYNAGGAAKVTNEAQAKAFVQQYGTSQQIAQLNGYATKVVTAEDRVKHATVGLHAAFSTLADVAEHVGSKSLTGVSLAAQANRQALTRAGDQLKSYRQELIAQGVPLAEVKKKVDDQAVSLQNQAVKLYGSKAAVDKLLGSLHALPNQVTTHIKVSANTKAAEAALQRLVTLRQNLSAGIDLGTITSQGARNAVQGESSSVTVNTRGRHAAGGMLSGPGTGTSDSIPAWLSNGEFVVNAKATARNLDLLHAINAQQFAVGGMATKPGAPTWLTSIGTPSANVATSGGHGSHGSVASVHYVAPAKAGKGPSKATVANAIASLLNYTSLTFTTELDGTVKEIRSGILGMIDRLNSAVRNHYLASDKTLVKTLARTRSTLTGLAVQEAATAAALSTAKQRLATLRGDASSVRSGALSSYQSLGDISQLSNVSSVSGIVSVLGQQDKVASAFTKNLERLRKKGLSKKAYDQLLAAGPGAAGNIVALLATATKSQLGQINGDEGLLTSLGQGTGSSSASYLYGARIAASKHQVRVLSKDERDEIDAQKKLVKSLDTLVRDGLQDHGTHKALADVNANLQDVKRLLQSVAGAPKAAKTNARTHVAGHGANR